MGSNQSSATPPSLGDVVTSLGGPSTKDWNSLFKDISQVRFSWNTKKKKRRRPFLHPAHKTAFDIERYVCGEE